MEYGYWANVFTELEKLGDSHYFVLTDSQSSLPDDFDKDTVVVLIGNERYTLPEYRKWVKAIFTHYVKSDCEGDNVFPVPHGLMYKLPVLPYKPLSNRKIDVLFCGWMHGRRSEVLRNLSMRLDGKVNCHFSHQNSATLIPSVYATDYLWNAKINLDLFGGHGPETFRYYESLLYGCVTVSQKKPDTWVYKDSPALFIDNWFDYDNIAGLILGLLTDPVKMEEISKKSREYYFNKYTEDRVALHIHNKLKEM